MFQEERKTEEKKEGQKQENPKRRKTKNEIKQTKQINKSVCFSVNK